MNLAILDEYERQLYDKAFKDGTVEAATRAINQIELKSEAMSEDDADLAIELTVVLLDLERHRFRCRIKEGTTRVSRAAMA